MIARLDVLVWRNKVRVRAELFILLAPASDGKLIYFVVSKASGGIYWSRLAEDRVLQLDLISFKAVCT